ncbi:Isocyanide synthase xanB [Fulvia fulva]|uniref:Isocyanide synthase xanB n=1 Tax=Passalora fulva TaxID=5499 RepID=A0A9Q8PF29_PASFU|nr:Isocyanide synthase xanB [Fulvia fulva]KAK4618684.1 Isocyanide synthase xanB [Fulvia fulva]UJO21247.1 Isocyanide synthase xanB [Fulvia fulva]WPV18471.1 Isocyanide synthase xanB [Fulvia fulva]WPV32862.1 Isocyanide synthase xanB [Fulvia fulva]
MARATATMGEDYNDSCSCMPFKMLKTRFRARLSSLKQRRASSIDRAPPTTSRLTETKRSTASQTSDDSSSTVVATPSQAEKLSNNDLDLARRILAIICRYKLPTRKEPLHDAESRHLEQICGLVSRSEPIQMCLPAFPFKSPNTSTKVLGHLPDKAEEFGLAHLNGLCAAIVHIYEPGASLMIISDGLVYNDLLGVPDKNVWAYGQALRDIATEQNLKHIHFSRLRDLAKINVPDKLDQITYTSNATNFRHALLSQYSDPEFDATVRIHEDENTCLTYRGYLKFLATDLQDVYPVGAERSKSQYKKGFEYIAKQMLFRGDAFARAVRETFPDHVRLSIHQTQDTECKISISLLPTGTSFTTPWHCCIAFNLDGMTTTGHHATFDADDRYELIHKNGRPSFYLEKSFLLSWGQDRGGISCDPLYPAGLMLRPSIEDVDGAKVRALAQQNSPVILRDFAKTRDRELFVQASHRMGTPTGWKFGLVLEVKDQGNDTRGLNNVLSSEWMPFHYDGLFKTEKRALPDGSEQLVPTPPKFQLFTSVTTSPKDTGFTLFSTSTLLSKYLPKDLPLEKLKTLTWSVSTSSFNAIALRNLPLVVDHPDTGKPCLRFHEPWPQEKTRFDATDINIENARGISEDGTVWTSKEICEILTDLLHDRRVCCYHSWEKGDLLVSDNILAHHTRSDFKSGSERELWRIHFE